MFEKDAEEYQTEKRKTFNEYEQLCWGDVYKDFLKGAEFGYNKANKWHKVADGDLPKDTTSLYLVRVYSWDFGLSHLYKKYTTYIPTVCEWNGEYFTALDNMAYSNARNINSCFAWKEIILPKESE
jgi:hypothetical protein